MNLPWLISEFIGTFTLIFIGAGSIIMNQLSGGSIGTLGIAIAHGLALGVLISAVAHISGGKLNPAVSLGLVIGGKLDIKTAVGEIIAQLAGAVVAALLLNLIYPAPAVEAVKLGSLALANGTTPYIGVLVEAILTFLLVFTVYGTVIDPRGSFKALAGLGVGLVVLFDILAGGALTGAGMNPARAFGPALVSGNWADHWVYWVGPILGGLAAGLLYSNVLLKNKTV